MRLAHNRGVSSRLGVRLSATLAAAAVVAAALALGDVALVGLVQRSLVDSLDAATLARARDVAALSQANRLQSTVASTGEDSAVVQVVDRSGKVRSASGNIVGEGPVLAPPPSTRKRLRLTLTGLPIGAGGQSFRIVAEPVALSDGPGWIYVATSLRQVDVATERLRALLFLGLPLVLVVVAAAIWGAVGRALRPVEQIRERAAAIGWSDLRDRLPVPRSRDEIARLALTMNAMLARLEDSALRQRRFIGDASHELRSPLSAMQAQVEVALAHPGAMSSAQVLRRVQDQTQRMTRLIDDLLYLARAEESGLRSGAEAVDLDELVLAEAQRLRALGGPSIKVGSINGVRVTGSERDLTRMLRNLADNAISHAKTTVTITLTATERDATLLVSDDGPGVPASDRARIFERFTRVDDARARPFTGTGAGLGLSITRQIVRAHGGEITIEDPRPPAQGVVFSVRLPRNDARKTPPEGTQNK